MAESIFTLAKTAVKTGNFTHRDLEFLRDGLIDTRELLQVVIPACIDTLRAAREAYNPEKEYSVGCGPVTLISVFGVEAIRPSHPPAGISTEQLAKVAHGLSQELGYFVCQATSAASFLALMEEPETMGAILEQPTGTNSSHVMGITPVLVVEDSQGKLNPFLDWRQLIDANGVVKRFAVTDSDLPPPITRYVNSNGLSVLYSDTFAQEPNRSGAIVFQKPTIER